MKIMDGVLCVLLAAGLASCNNAGKGSDEVDTTVTGAAAPDNTQDKAINTDTTPPVSTVQLDEDTKSFMTKAASGGMMEVELGTYAQQSAANARVKNFGAMMERDHSTANGELRDLAGRKNVVLPATLEEKHQKHVADMKKKTGKDFDKAYMKMMVDDHEKDIKEFEKAGDKTNDPDVKAFVVKTLPTLRTHLDSAKAIVKSL